MNKADPGTYIGSLARRIEDIKRLEDIKKNEEQKQNEVIDDDPSLWGMVDLDEFNYDEFLLQN